MRFHHYTYSERPFFENYRIDIDLHSSNTLNHISSIHIVYNILKLNARFSPSNNVDSYKMYL